MFKIAKRTQDMNESATLQMAQMARELTSKGHDIINLSLGEPDFDTPLHIKEKAIEAIRQGFTKYTPVAGTMELREAISRKFLRENHLDYKPSQIVVSNGAKQSFANLCFATLNKGDEVIIFSPYWVSYFEIIKLAGAIPVIVSSEVNDDYKPSASDLKKAITNQTRFIIFSSPCNPTGTVFTRIDFENYVDVLKNYPDIFIVADEIYEHILFEDDHISIGSFYGMNERTVTINGFSKGFAMTGWRLGYMGAPKEIADACTKIQGQFTSGAASFTQKAGAFALESDLTPTKEMCAAFKNRRDVLLNKIAEITKWKVNQPKGAFYVLPEVDAYFNMSYEHYKINTANDLAIYILNEAQVALVSGEAFGAPKCLRISYSLSEAKIIEAVDRIKKALDKLS
ncbi:MAG: pyridoxal phosphate-dependent aminotransferase [Bacteroidota bacterium]|nr:pyridoxal phosphate-dependent aminotransferase [Bacteroidota bacterium]